MMNLDNKISSKTVLFGYIAEHAAASRFSVLTNKIFQANAVDAMIIPMNIREDDLYFTLSNMKKSHVNGAVISSEYVNKVLDVIDETTALVQRSQMCDIVYKEGETLRGDIFSVRVLIEYLKDLNISTIALVGTNHYAKAFSFLSCGFKVSYFNDNLEELMEFGNEVDLQNPDINRIASGMSLDFGSYDALLDFSDMDDFSMIEKLALNNFDMKHSKEFSALKKRANELSANYIGYDDLVEPMSSKVAEIIS